MGFVKSNAPSERTGWLEKWNEGRIASIVEVKYHRVLVKKTRRKKAGGPLPAQRDAGHYFLLDKKVHLGRLSLTGDGVFAKNELLEVELPVPQHQTRLRFLGKAMDTTTFLEHKRVIFRALVHFSAVNKEDFQRLVALEDQRLKLMGPAPVMSKSRVHRTMTFRAT
jgi:hypothetical protein